jgi:hypothetical protein
MTTTILAVADSEWPRIYALFDRAMTHEIAAQAGVPFPDDESCLEDVVDLVGEMYGVDALHMIFTGRSPRA